jgi:STE24 endopeptidase
VTNLRALLIVAAVSIGSALVVGLVSRAPASVRADQPPVEARDPSLGARFTEEQIARHGAYRAPAYVGFALALVVEFTLLIVLARGPWGRLVTAVERVPGGWPLRALILGAIAAALATLATLPLAFVRGYVIEHAWGRSTQDVTGWLGDVGRSLGVGAVIAGVAAVVFFTVLRWQPRVWWVLGWAAFTLLTAAMTFLYPIAIAPLFNRFTPLEEGSLRGRALAMASEAGVTVDEVLVADASRRTTAENAYVAGLGSSKQLVLYDTLLAAGSEDETLHVIAHELGHRAENHVPQNVLIASLGLFVGFGGLAWLSHRDRFWSWGGAEGIADLRAIPLLMLFVAVLTLLLMPVENLISRSHEGRADAIALELTDDPDTAISTFRRLAFSNLADLRPPAPVVALLYTHPPIDERIERALRAGGHDG